MNGYEGQAVAAGVFSASSSRINRDSPETPGENARSRAKALTGSDEIYFLRSSAKHKKKSQKQRKPFTRTSINSLTNTSQYHVEHLTTFVLDRKDGMVTVDDGVRRLRLLDVKGKVWTQEMLLQVEERGVSLIDQETKNELEHFPIGSVQLCQAVMNTCSYDSILALVCKDSGQSKPDLHLFQCDDIKADLIHADIESAMADARGGKVKKRPEALKMILKSDGIIPPPPAAPAPEPPAPSQVDVKSRAAAWSAWTNEQQGDERQRQTSGEDGPVEMTAARVDRDVQILNHILDDIEFFITKLQKAAEAFSELSKRKKSKKGKKKSPGDGVLSLRSRLPAEEDFVDCLQKFKHAFNQLARLQDHIQKPSAEDLLHFLFSPLRMVVQASGSVDLARSVVVPLLTKEAIDLLHCSGSEEERRLWAGLGEGWTRCRLEWPKDHYFPPCVLRFRDGWEPPAPASREQELTQLVESLTNGAIQRQEAGAQAFAPADGSTFANTSYQCTRILDQDTPAGRPAVRSSDSRGQSKLFAKSKYDFVARNNTELSVLKDEVVQVLDDRKQWWKVCNGCGASGYVPNNILEITKVVDITGRAEPIYSHTIQKQTSRPDYVPGKPAMTPTPGAPVTPPSAPARLPTPPLPPPATEATHPAASTVSGDTRSVTTQDQRPADRESGRRSNMEEVQDELMHRLTLGRSAQRKFQVPSRSGDIPSCNITYDSPPGDVTAWLEAKGFSPVTITSLGVLTGAQLFSLNKEELKTVCPDDGARVFSQVTVQKAALEKSSGSELQEIMRRRQEKLAASTCDSGVESFDEGSAH